MEVTRVFPRFSLNVPADWVDESVVTFVGPVKDGLAANVVITAVPVAGDWRQVVDRELADLVKQARRYRRVYDAELEHHGAPARRVEQTFQTGGGLVIRQIQLFVASAGLLFTASISHADQAFEATRPQLEALLAGLRIGAA